MAKEVTLYQMEQSADNPAHFKCIKLNDDYEVLETYHISKLGSHQMICTCPAGSRDKGCRHQTMLREFEKNKVVGQKWSYNYDKGAWIAPLGTFDEEA